MDDAENKKVVSLLGEAQGILENNIKMDLKEQRVRCQLEACGSP
jgi:hypothetical protein